MKPVARTPCPKYLTTCQLPNGQGCSPIPQLPAANFAGPAISAPMALIINKGIAIRAALQQAIRTLPAALGLVFMFCHTTWALGVNQADQLVKQWLDTERQASRLESDWQVQKPLLEQRIELLKAQRRQLNQVLSKSQAGRTEAESKRAALLARQTEMESQQSRLQGEMKRVEIQLQELSQQLPPPLQTVWQAETLALDETPKPSAQLQAILTQMTKLLEFDRRITVNETTIITPQGANVLVKQLYLGAGTAWFSNADGTVTGSGRAEPDGWQWLFDDTIDGDAVSRAIAMFQHQREAALVQLPLDLGREK